MDGKENQSTNMAVKIKKKKKIKLGRDAQTGHWVGKRVARLASDMSVHTARAEIKVGADAALEPRRLGFQGGPAAVTNYRADRSRGGVRVGRHKHAVSHKGGWCVSSGVRRYTAGQHVIGGHTRTDIGRVTV